MTGINIKTFKIIMYTKFLCTIQWQPSYVTLYLSQIKKYTNSNNKGKGQIMFVKTTLLSLKLKKKHMKELFNFQKPFLDLVPTDGSHFTTKKLNLTYTEYLKQINYRIKLPIKITFKSKGQII